MSNADDARGDGASSPPMGRPLAQAAPTVSGVSLALGVAHDRYMLACWTLHAGCSTLGVACFWAGTVM